jgi:F420-dependent oxidoreductase-like protein
VRLGLSVGHLRGAADVKKLAVVPEADRLGYSVVWASEAYGSDVVSVLGYLAARTESISIGSAVMQIPGRSPALTAMTAATLDVLSGGRFRCGLGVSGPQVSEGWHGVEFAEPLSRTREYVEIVRMALARQPVEFHGKHFDLPRAGGRPIKLSVHPIQERIPLYLAATGPKNLQLSGEITDGWLGLFVSPDHLGELTASIQAGRTAAGLTMDGFDVTASLPVVFGDDVEACADQVRAYSALYVGGMGSRAQNFYNALAVRMGFEAAAKEVQDLYLGGDAKAAAAAMPFEFIDQTALLGSVDRVAERLRALAEAGVTTFAMIDSSGSDPIGTVRQLATAFEKSGVG